MCHILPWKGAVGKVGPRQPRHHRGTCQAVAGRPCGARHFGNTTRNSSSRGRTATRVLASPATETKYSPVGNPVEAKPPLLSPLGSGSGAADEVLGRDNSPTSNSPVHPTALRLSTYLPINWLPEPDAGRNCSRVRRESWSVYTTERSWTSCPDSHGGASPVR